MTDFHHLRRILGGLGVDVDECAHGIHRALRLDMGPAFHTYVFRNGDSTLMGLIVESKGAEPNERPITVH